MKKKSLLLSLLLLSFCLCLIHPNSTYAATVGDQSNVFPAQASDSLKSQYDSNSTYTSLMSSQYAAYYIKTQPMDALVLGSSYTLSDPIHGYVDSNDNPICIWNLPILKAGYYYVLDTNDYLTMPDYTYPIIELTKSVPSTTTSIPLYIYNRSTNIAEVTVTLKINSNVTMAASDKHYVEDNYAINVMSKAVDATDTWYFAYEGVYYPYEVYDAIFTDGNVLSLKTPSEDSKYTVLPTQTGYNLNMASKASGQTNKSYTVRKLNYSGVRPIADLTGTGSYINIDLLNCFGDDLKGGLLTYTVTDKKDLDDSKLNSYNHTRGVNTVSDNTYAQSNVTAMSLLTPNCGYYIVSEGATISNAKSGMSTTPINDAVTYEVGVAKNLRKNCQYYPGAFVADVTGAADEYNDTATSTGFKYTTDEYGETEVLVKNDLAEDHNVVSLFAYGMYKSHVGGISSGATKHYTLTFDSNGGSTCANQSIVMSQIQAPTLPTPTKSGYTFKGWCTDSLLKTSYDYFTFTATAGGNYTLYAKWELVTGPYTVQFYDELNGTSSTSAFTTPNDPTLPTNPKYTGYSFKCWTIVANKNATAGTTYNPDTFTPEINGSYIFKATYDTVGIITDVTLTKSSYYVGQSIDKSKISVTVQTNDTGTTRVLGTSEFTVSPTKITTVGTTTVTVVYTATGATATCQINGIEDSLKSISATYSGSSLTVGSTIATSQIAVTGTYASGTTASLSSFSISPTTVTAVGTNTITVTSGGLSTTLTVTGVSSGSTTTTTSIKTLTVAYVGPTLYVGDTLASSDFNVRVLYSDGTTKLLNSGDYTFTPTNVSSAGTNTIVISYSGFSATLTVNVLSKTGATTTTTTNTAGATTTTTRNADGTTTTTVTNADGTTSSTTTNASGNLAVVSKSDGKGTSTGYISGKNVLDMLTGADGASGSVMNTFDIQGAFDAVTSKSTSINLPLINGSIGDQILAANLAKLKKCKVPATITMSDASTGNTVGVWTLDPSKMGDDVADFDPNINLQQFTRASQEHCVGYSTNNETIPTYAILAVPLDAYIAQGTQFNLYKMGVSMNNVGVDGLNSYDGSQFTFPSENVFGYAVSDHAAGTYPADWIFTNEYTWDTIAQSANAAGNTVEEAATEISAEATEATTEAATDAAGTETSTKKGLPFIAVIVIVVAGISIVGAGVALLLVKKGIIGGGPQIPDDSDESDDDIDIDGDDVDDQSEETNEDETTDDNNQQ